MLSLDLLRTKTSRGKIMPLFCTAHFGNGTDYELAHKLITYFTNALKDNESKGTLLQKSTLLESAHDYKLVRGLFALLERRSVFGRLSSSIIANPIVIRQKLFEASSEQGLALSDPQRQDIIRLVANQMHISPNELETLLWSDRDDNLILTQFDTISPNDLILWYNLSLSQTLLFKCIELEFSIKGGLYWKQVLRNVKRYGLMYNLEYTSNNDDSIKCVLEGPLSLFKMTDRYGTSMAKLLPSIIRTPTWKIKGSIIRKTDDGQKIYQFELSSENTSEFLRSMSDSTRQNNDSEMENEDYLYDSSLEATFAKRFHQYFDKNNKFGWKISREPDPLIADGKAMIPDFLFERFGRKVYLEIVGFWTQEYLERKATKLKALIDNNSSKNKTSVDLLVAVNSELSCSQINTISKNRIFTFKKDVSLKPILEHLKNIDAEIIEEKIKNTTIKLDKQNSNLISIQQIASDYSIPEEAALKILQVDYPDYVTSELYMISKQKIDAINNLLCKVSKFVEACALLSSHEIPDSCHADLLSKLGYDVIWNDLDPNNATITKKNG